MLELRTFVVVFVLIISYTVAGTAPVSSTTSIHNQHPVAEHSNNTQNDTEIINNINFSYNKGGDKNITTQSKFKNENDRGAVVIETYPNSTDVKSTLSQHGMDIDLRIDNRIQGTINQQHQSTFQSIPWVKTVRTPYYANKTTISQGVSAMNAEAIQNQGITGENIKVGVIDDGFDTINSEISDNIVETNSFVGDITNYGNNVHGTAVSEIVVDTAPDASLYVSNVGSMVEFASAIDWMLANDVDLISTSLGWYSAPQDGTSLVSQKATEATENGVTFVASAGNAANRHWQDQFTDSDGDNWAEFDQNLEANYLNNAEPFTGTISVTLTWNDWENPSADYDLYLFKESQPDQPVATSTQYQQQGARPYEHITYSASDYDRYYVGIAEHDASGSEKLELFAANSDLYVTDSSSSMTAPSVAVNATSVGAHRYDTNSVEPFSSRGPTNDGRPGLTVVGPDGVTTDAMMNPFYGTSAGAPHVSGVVALMKAKNPSLTPHQINSILTTTATDMNVDGYDYVSGNGRINASAAVRSADATIESTSLAVSNTTASVTDSVRINTTVTNTGLVSGTETIGLRINGSVEQNRSVSLDAGETRKLSFGTTFATAGTRSIAVGELPPEEVVVTNKTTGDIKLSKQTVQNQSTSLTVADVSASVNYYVEVTNEGGDIIGTTPVYPPHTAHSSLTVELNQQLQSNQTVTATVREAANGSPLANGTASIIITEVPADAVYKPGSAAANYDSNNDGVIGITELGQAATDYATGKLQIDNLGSVAIAYASS